MRLLSTRLRTVAGRLTATILCAALPLTTGSVWRAAPSARADVLAPLASEESQDGLAPDASVVESDTLPDMAPSPGYAEDDLDVEDTFLIKGKPVRATPAPLPTATPAPVLTPTPAPSPTATGTPTPAASGQTTLYGTLLSDYRRASQEYAASVRIVHLELGWDAYEPEDGVFSASYAAAARERLQAMQAAGMHVVLGLGLQYPPSWVYRYPDSRYVNQYGVAAGPVNLTFNQALRDRAERYLARVHADLGLHNFWAVRIGSGGLIESLYPGMSDGTHSNSYWAFDSAAQGASGRPATVPASPLPGWKPGDRSLNGQPISRDQVQRWYDWYLGSMVDGINWQIAAYKRLGYAGRLQVLMPGLGSRPSEYATAISSYLDGTGDSNHTMGRAAAWHKVVEGIGDRTNVVVYVSSVADGSGGNDLCQATDAAVSLGDTAVNAWSATRWVSYNANRVGLAKDGENPGRSDTRTYGTAMMDTAARQARACGFQSLMWAHDANLYDAASGVTLADYSATIARYT